MLIKDATALERLRKVDVLVTDKTGTLTIPNKNVDFTKADNLPLEARESLKPNCREAMDSLQGDGNRRMDDERRQGEGRKILGRRPE